MVYVFTRVLRYPFNTIIAWTIDNYHEKGNTIITILLLPLGHISNSSMLTREKNLKATRGNGYHFVPKGGTFSTENHHACCEKLRFVRSIYPNLPQMGQIFYHGMLMPLHDNMPSFMNFRWALDLLEFKNQVYISQCLRRVMVAGCLTFIPISCMGPKHASKDTDLIFQPIYMHWSMHVVQIWIMHIKCIEKSDNA